MDKGHFVQVLDSPLFRFSKYCTYKGKKYIKGDVLENAEDFASVWNLNEKGYIEPITKDEFLKLQKKLKKKEEE